MKKTITYKEIKDKVLDIINNGGGVGGKSKLSELNDVTITSASDGQVLKYNGTKWVNGTAGGNVKSFTYEPFTSNTIVPLDFPTDCNFILRATYKNTVQGGGVSWLGGIPRETGDYSLIGSNTYSGDDAGTLYYCKAKVNNDKFEIRANSSDWHLPYNDGWALTIYYI